MVLISAGKHTITGLLQVAATLYEWEHIAERFEKSTHYREKALHKLLITNIVPVAVSELKVRADNPGFVFF